MKNYPKRPKFFANRVVRAMLKTCAAQSIGHGAFTLVAIIAHTEDAGSYRAPVTWFNDQLLAVCAFSSQRLLIAARQRAIDAGWLHYLPGRKGVAGQYWVDIPERFWGLDDAQTSETPAEYALSDAPVKVDKCASESASEREVNPENALAPGEAQGKRKGSESASAREVKAPVKDVPTLVVNFPVPIPVPIPLPPVGGGQAETPSGINGKSKPDESPTKPRPRDLLFDTIADVTGTDPKASGSHIGKVVALLKKADPAYTPDEVKAWAVKIRELWGMQPTVGMIEKYIGKIRSSDPLAWSQPGKAGMNGHRTPDDPPQRCLTKEEMDHGWYNAHTGFTKNCRACKNRDCERPGCIEAQGRAAV